MLHVEFQAPKPSGSEDDIFIYTMYIFLCISTVQTHDSLAWGHFIPASHHLNKLGKGLLGHATYQISSI